MRTVLACLTVAGVLGAGSAATAHTAWLEREAKPGVWKLMFGGHQGKPEPAVPGKLKSLTAVDARGRPVKLTRTVDGSDVRLTVPDSVSMIALHYDNGIHTRTATPGPSIEKPMNQVPGAVSATNAVKYGKTIVRWSPAVTKPIAQPLEVIPLDAAAPVAGRPMRVQVRLDGKPAPGVKIGRGEDVDGATTDTNGVASFTPVAGYNKLWAGKRIETKTDPRYTQLSYEYLLGFDAR